MFLQMSTFCKMISRTHPCWTSVWKCIITISTDKLNGSNCNRRKLHENWNILKCLVQGTSALCYVLENRVRYEMKVKILNFLPSMFFSDQPELIRMRTVHIYMCSVIIICTCTGMFSPVLKPPWSKRPRYYKILNTVQVVMMDVDNHEIFALDYYLNQSI